MFEKIVKMYKRELITLQEMVFKLLSLPEINCKLLDIEGNNIYIKLSINKETLNTIIKNASIIGKEN